MIVPFIAVTRYFIQTKCRKNCLPNRSRLINQSLAKNLPNYGLKCFLDEFIRCCEKKFPGRRKDSLVVIWCTKNLPRLSRSLKNNSVAVAKNCVEQIEFVIAQRIRRGQQMFMLYSRLWDEKALRAFFQRMRRLLQKRSRHFLIGASAIVFDWESERIPIEELKRHADEMEFCKILRTRALLGNGGDNSQTSAEPECSCSECTCTHCGTDPKDKKWEPFIIEDDLTVWKMLDPNNRSSGLHCYKLYGKYSDVTARDFLTVFLDTENRTKWDSHAALLKVIDTEPSSQSDVIYWETRWPTLFSNRDYVFKRRYYVDETNNVIVVMNQSTQHPSYPPISSKARVTEYWSYMVIKANENLDKPGIEFSLTYFDNPGISMPSALSLWVTVQGIPEYLKRLRIEALKLSEKRREEEREEEEREGVERRGDEEPAAGGTRDRCRPPGPPSPEPAAPSHGGGGGLSTYDYVLIISSCFQKVRASLCHSVLYGHGGGDGTNMAWKTPLKRCKIGFSRCIPVDLINKIYPVIRIFIARVIG